MKQFKEIEKYFPKGDKRRGEALVVNAEAYLLGKKEEREKNLKIIKIWDNKVDTLVNDLIEEIKQSSSIKESEKMIINRDKTEITHYAINSEQQVEINEMLKAFKIPTRKRQNINFVNINVEIEYFPKQSSPNLK